MDKTSLAHQLIALRKQKGLSQEQLANLSGVAIRTIQRIESASVNAHLQTLSLIANVLQIDVKELTGTYDVIKTEKSKKNWLVLLHFSPIIGSIIPSGSFFVPFGLWLYKRHEDAIFDEHGKSVLNFQLSMLAMFTLAFVMIFVFTPVGIFLIFGSIIFNILMVIINSFKVSSGKNYTYLLAIPFFKKRTLSVVSAIILTLFLFTHPSNTNAQQLKRIDGTSIKVDSLQKHIAFLMEKAKINGLEVTIFNQNKIAFKQAFGFGSYKKPLQTSSSIYGASLSKTTFTVLVLKLVEEGILDLDKPLQDYLEKPIYEYTQKTKWQDNYNDLRTDSLYKKITARMCLDHTSGFPNWRWGNADQKLKVAFEPGSRYSYSGEGMVYLQTVIEKITGKTLAQLMQKKIFSPFQMINSAYTFLPRFESDFVVGYNAEGKFYQKDKDNEARAPSTLETSLDDYSNFVAAILQGKALKKQSRKEMFHPQIRIRSIAQFGPLAKKDSSANDGISLSYGLGWGLLKSPYGWGAFKEGHGDGFQHYCIIFPELGIGIIIMTNSDNGESIFKELLALGIGDTYTPWKWQNYIPYDDKSLK